MKYVYLFLQSFMLCALLVVFSKGQATPLEEQLEMYGYFTQIGTVARRTYRDGNRRVVKTIYYTTKDCCGLPPYTEAMLSVQSVVLYKYDERGYQIKSEHYDAAMNLTQVWETTYQNDNEKRLIKYTPAGIRQYELRYVGKSAVSDLHYDEQGKNLVAIRGLVPSDIDLPFGWGESVNGLACGLGIAQVTSELDGLAGYAIYVNVRNTGSQVIFMIKFPPVEIELRDSSGKLVREKAEYRKKKQDRLQAHRQFYGDVIHPGASGFTYPAYELNARYAPLAPGRYLIRVKQPVKGRGKPLISNPLVLEIASPKQSLQTR